MALFLVGVYEDGLVLPTGWTPHLRRATKFEGQLHPEHQSDNV